MKKQKMSIDKKRQKECNSRISFLFQKSIEKDNSSCDVVLCCPEKTCLSNRFKSDNSLKQVFKPSISQLKEPRLKKSSEKEKMENFCLKNSLTNKVLPKIELTPNISSKNKTLSIFPKVNILNNNGKKYFNIYQI